MGHPMGSHTVSLLRCGLQAKPESLQKSAWPLTSQKLKFHLPKDLVRASQMVLVVKNPPVMQNSQETWIRSLGQEDPLE